MSTILKLCEMMPDVTCDAGEVLLSEGSRTGLMYILISGEVEILKGNVQVDVISQPGAPFGEVSLLLKMPHLATVRVLKPSRLYRIDNAADFLDSHPEMVSELARILAYRLSRATNYLVDLRRHFNGLAGALISVAIEGTE